MRPLSRLLTLFVAVLWTLGGAAAPASAAPALWQVSDGDSSVYLFGSIHMMDDNRDWRTAQFDKLVAEADHVYFEVILDAKAFAEVTRQMLVNGRYTDGRTLWDDLTDEQAKKLRAEGPAYGLDMTMISSLRPWVVQQALASYALGGSDKLSASALRGVEMVLQAEVPADRQRALETVDMQFAVLSGGSTSEQVEDLMGTLDGLKELKGRNPLSELAEHWADGDIDAIVNDAFEEMEPGSPSYRRYFSDRNKKWVETAEQLLASNDQSLFVVGAGHLVGPDGLPALLEQAGYTVRRVDLDEKKGAATAAPSPFAVTRR